MTTKEQSEILMREMISFAKSMLSKHAEFAPFGGMLRPTGKVAHLSALIEDTEFAAPKDLIKVLHGKLKKEAESGRAIASAVVYNVANISDPQTGENTNAIQVCLEHTDNYVVDVLVPYDIDSAEEPLYGTLFAQKGEQIIFV